MSGRLEGKAAVVTGGASGIGRATAELFMAEGAKVVVADIQTDKGAQMEREFAASMRFARCDVTQEADIEAAVALAVAEFGRLDIMFNNAATPGTPAYIEDITVEDWDAAHALILRSVMLGCKHAARVMGPQGGGSIVNTSSGVAIVPFSRNRGPAYGTMKAGVAHLTKFLAAELGPKNIRVNAVLPGFIMTPILGGSSGAPIAVADRMMPYLEESFAELGPSPRAGYPADIAEAVLYLASDAAGWVSGVNLPVDGGFTVDYRTDTSGIFPAARARAEAELAAEAEGSQRS